MLINTLKSLLREDNASAVSSFLWLLNQIDVQKIYSRMRHAMKYPSTTVKCVLLEYKFTPRWYVAQGNEKLVDYLPNTNKRVHDVVLSNDVLDMLRFHLGDFNSKIKFYTRQKICAGNCPDFTTKQLVMLFEPYAFVPPPPPPSYNYQDNINTINPEDLDDDDEYADMPPLIPARNNF